MHAKASEELGRAWAGDAAPMLLHDPDAAPAEMAALVPPGGRVVVLVPAAFEDPDTEL